MPRVPPPLPSALRISIWTQLRSLGWFYSKPPKLSLCSGWYIKAGRDKSKKGTFVEGTDYFTNMEDVVAHLDSVSFDWGFLDKEDWFDYCACWEAAKVETERSANDEVRSEAEAEVRQRAEDEANKKAAEPGEAEVRKMAADEAKKKAAEPGNLVIITHSTSSPQIAQSRHSSIHLHSSFHSQHHLVIITHSTSSPQIAQSRHSSIHLHSSFHSQYHHE
jgi:hypothetical protein